MQKLQSRTRTLLPTSKQLLDPEIATNVGVRLRKKAAKQQHDRGAKQLPPLSSGQIVQVQPINHGEKWKKATILKQVGERSYLVKTLTGHIYRRNRKFIRATKEGMELAQKKTLRMNFMFQSQKSKKHLQTRQITQRGKNQIQH